MSWSELVEVDFHALPPEDPWAEPLEKVWRSLLDPETGRDLISAKIPIDSRRDGQRLNVSIGLPRFAAALRDHVAQQVRQRLEKQPELKGVDIDLVVGVAKQERAVPRLGQAGVTIKAVIAVGSGKGGVGKSTVATGLAMALSRSGARVGLLDADVYGPSIPLLTGTGGQPEVVGDKIQPLRTETMPVMSIGFLVPSTEAVIWRGPMLHQAITRFVRDVAWGELDYLIVDMPPGTGDVAITLTQLLPVTGAVVVCTPQDVALADAIKAVGMLRKVKVPILGIVENMSGFVCPGCSRRYDIFGKGGAREYAEQESLALLGELPITMSIRECGDSGTMWRLLDDPQTAPAFETLATRLVQGLASRAALAPPKPQLPVLG